MSDTTTKWSIPFLEGTDIGDQIDDVDAARAALLDGLLTPYSQGARASRPTSTPGSPGKAGRTYRSADDGGVDVDYGTGWATVKPGSGTALPSSPDDGMLWDLIVDSAGSYGGPVVWRCRYRAAGGTYKWEASGQPLVAVNTTTSTGFGAWPAYVSNLGVPAPVTGVYVVSMAADIARAGVDVPAAVDWGIAPGDTAPIFGGTVYPEHTYSSVVSAAEIPMTLTAAQTANLRLSRYASGVSPIVKHRSISIRPVRLG